MHPGPRPLSDSIFDLLLFPCGAKTAWWGLILASILTSFLVLIAYRLLARPDKTRRQKDRIKANILALRVYRDFPTVIMRSFFQSIGNILRYIGQNLAPLLALLPLLFILYVQMEVRFGNRPFRKSETFAVKAKFRTAIGDRTCQLQDNPIVKAVMRPVRIKPLDEVDWKLKATESGVTYLRFKVGTETARKQVACGDLYLALSEEINSSRLYRFLYSGDGVLPADSALKSISLEYPARRIRVLGFSASWLVPYILLILVVVLALKRPFRVEF